MGYAKLRVDGRLLVNVLHLPVDVRMLDARWVPSSDMAGCRLLDIELVVWHKDIPDLEPVADVPHAVPIFVKDEDGNCSMETWGVE